MNVFDIIGPIMIGPSSSHTAGAARLGKAAKTIFARDIARAEIYMHGSFAKTGVPHGTDKAIIAGLLGMDADDDRLRYSFDIAKDRGLDFAFFDIELKDVHPNTARILLKSADGSTFSMEGSSIGGGSIRVHNLEGYEVSLNFEKPTLVVRHIDHPGVIAAVTEELYKYDVNICEFYLSRQSKGGEALMSIGLDSLPESEALRNIADMDYVLAANMLNKV